MKSTIIKYLFLSLFLIFLVACSTKKNTFLTRNYNAVTTEYNILYNGGIALDKGISELKLQYNDNYWETLPVERMQILEKSLDKPETKNVNFELAEKKATKAIQKHSMNIDGGEKNPQMDEAHLMLGKARYYDQRFVPALEAFNYVLYKYPNSDKIYEVKIWREKTNMRMDNDALAVTNLRKLLKEIKFKDQIFADANATLAQAFLNLKENDSAIAKLKLAKQFTKESEEKARYNFILGQVYSAQNHKDSAFVSFQDVIDMKRKSPRLYIIQAHAQQAQQFDYKNGDTIAFLKKYNDLLEDRENRQYLDVLNHQMGLFYDKKNNITQAKKYYNESLKKASSDEYLIASNYRNLAEINFNDAKYLTAGKYLDSTMAYLNNRTREYKTISKKRNNLEDVIKFEEIVQRNDSILKIAEFSPLERENYFQKHIEDLKKEELKAKALLDKKNQIAENASSNQETAGTLSFSAPKATTSKSGDFYFYNPVTVAYGKTEFAKNWGKRQHGPNWRNESGTESNDFVENNTDTEDVSDKTEKVEERFTTNFYTKSIPTSQVVLDSISKERNFAYYQLGVIYKEKFKEYKRASNKLERLLDNNPEERLVLPTLYNLYKIYQITEPSKVQGIKNRIITNYPSSRYAQLLSDNKIELELGSPEIVYGNLFKEYELGNFRETLNKTDMAIVQFAGEEMLPKFELLKANLIGKLYGLKEYKKALNFVALTYPNSEEGKDTENFIATKIPVLESLYFNGEIPSGWKVVYAPANSLDAKSIKPLVDKLAKFAKERTIETLKISNDIYTIDQNLIVIHGIKSEENAKGIAQVLKEFKDYKIAEPAAVISSENYKVVQIYKNLDEYVSGKGPNFEVKEKAIIKLPEPEAPKNTIQKPQRGTKNNNVESKTKSQALENSRLPNGQNNGMESMDKAPTNNMMPPGQNSQPTNGMMPPGQNSPTKKG